MKGEENRFQLTYLYHNGRRHALKPLLPMEGSDNQQDGDLYPAESCFQIEKIGENLPELYQLERICFYGIINF